MAGIARHMTARKSHAHQRVPQARGEAISLSCPYPVSACHPELARHGVPLILRQRWMRDKGDCDDCLPVTVRRALLFYLLDEMRILSAVRKRDVKLAQAASIWVQDLDSVCAELNRMDMRDLEPIRTLTSP